MTYTMTSQDIDLSSWDILYNSYLLTKNLRGLLYYSMHSAACFGFNGQSSGRFTYTGKNSTLTLQLLVFIFNLIITHTHISTVLIIYFYSMNFWTPDRHILYIVMLRI